MLQMFVKIEPAKVYVDFGILQSLFFPPAMESDLPEVLVTDSWDQGAEVMALLPIFDSLSSVAAILGFKMTRLKFDAIIKL